MLQRTWCAAFQCNTHDTWYPSLMFLWFHCSYKTIKTMCYSAPDVLLFNDNTHVVWYPFSLISLQLQDHQDHVLQRTWRAAFQWQHTRRLISFFFDFIAATRPSRPCATAHLTCCFLMQHTRHLLTFFDSSLNSLQLQDHQDHVLQRTWRAACPVEPFGRTDSHVRQVPDWLRGAVYAGAQWMVYD